MEWQLSKRIRKTNIKSDADEVFKQSLSQMAILGATEEHEPFEN